MSDAGTRSTAEPPFSDLEKKAWGALLALSILLHLVQLGSHALHHDESIHAWAAQHLIQDGTYKYDPVYHGPVQYFAVAATYGVASALGKVAGVLLGIPAAKTWDGTSDYTARLAPALGGIALTLMALLLRRRFGRGAAFAAGALAAFSPNLLYYTRFCRDDVWSLVGTAGIFLWFDQYLARGRLRDLCFASLSASVAFASKENFYVLLALMVPSIAAAWAEPGRGLDVWNRLRRLIDWLEAHTVPLVGALLLFFCVSEVLYTFFLVHPESGNPVFDAISYWWGQHKMERVGGPKTFYLPRLLQYEFAIVLPALLLVATRWKRFTFAERFLAGWALSSVAMYAYLGEKAGWLIVHQVLPFLPLAGAAWALLAGKGLRAKLGGAVVAAASVLTAVTLSFVYPVLTPNSRKAESTIQVQTCPEMLGLVDEILAYGKAGEVPAAIVSGEAGWPMSWYVRKAPVNWQAPKGDLRPPIVLCDEGDADKQAGILGPSYRRDRVPFRAWWIPDTSRSPLRPNLKQLLLYVFTRETWDRADGNNPIGSVWVTVFRRTGPAPASPPPPAPAPAADAPAGQLPADTADTKATS
ncbi:MAG TPA: flippase activity-associated protein Agl23 [Thermoanaerobaculia bacterium]